MPYKIVPTKVCSECGQVLESIREDYCDGCNIPITERDYDHHIRIGFLMEDHETHKDDMVFHSLECFRENIAKINLDGVSSISIEFLHPKMFHKMSEILSTKRRP